MIGRKEAQEDAKRSAKFIPLPRVADRRRSGLKSVLRFFCAFCAFLVP